MPHVISTLASSTDYVGFIVNTDKNGGPHIPNRRVSIKGGSGVANRQHALAEGVLTPDGVATKITDEDLEFLESNEHFKKHLALGHVRVVKHATPAAKVAKDMSKKDPSAPLTDADFKDGGRATPQKLPDGVSWNGVKAKAIQ